MSVLAPVRRLMEPAHHLPPWAPAAALKEWTELRADEDLRPEAIGPVEARPVLLVPGFGAPSRAMSVLETWLEGLGMRPRTVGTGFALGCSEANAGALERSLDEEDEPAILLAHSRGGQFARVVATRRPDRCAALITMGTPMRVGRDVFHPLLQAQLMAMAAAGTVGVPGLARLSCMRGSCCAEFRRDLARPVSGVPFLALHSRADRTVRWESCLAPEADNVEVGTTHVGMLASVGSFRALAGFLTRHFPG